MENIELLGTKHFPIVPEDVGRITAFSNNSEGCVVITDLSHIGICANDEKFEWFILEDIQCINHVEYLGTIDCVFVADTNQMVVYDFQAKSIRARELCTQNNITTVSWNLLQTHLVAITDNGRLNLYSFNNTSFILMGEIDLDADIPGRDVLGWGVPRTKGSKRNETVVEDNLPATSIGGPAKVSWRGNHHQFVVNYYSEKMGSRFIKVFRNDTNGFLCENISDKRRDLECPVSFMQQGQSIACSEMGKNGNKLLLFEKNCQFLESHDIPFTNGRIKNIVFHPENCNILAVHHENCNHINYIDIYFYYVGQWYHKQQICSTTSKSFQGFGWVTSDLPLLTIVVCGDEQVIYHTFRFVTNRCLNTATTGIVNGGTVSFCIYDDAVKPPPFDTWRVDNKIPINRLLFHPVEPFCLLIESSMNVICVDYSKQKCQSLNLNAEQIVKFHSVTWMENNIVQLCMICRLKAEMTELAFEVFDMNLNISFCEMNTNEEYLLPAEIIEILPKPYVPYKNGIKYVYLMSLKIQKDIYEFALGRNRELFINDEFIGGGVTSLCAHQNYILFTHENDQLYCIRHEEISQFLVKKKLEVLFSQSIAEGSKLLAVRRELVPSIILTVPRGELLTVTCRLITIDRIVAMVKANYWSLCIQTVRREKIDSNILVDVDPEHFLNNIENVIAATKEATNLISIVNSFDMTNNSSVGEHPSKQDIIDVILQTLQNNTCLDYSVKAAAVIKLKHKSIKDALKSVQEAFSQREIDKKNEFLSSVIKYLITLDNPKRVIQAAYLQLDLPFLLFVYQQTNEDPEVYTKIINDLNSKSLLAKHFQMCLDGGDVARAAEFMVDSSEFSDIEVGKFLEKHTCQQVAYCHINENHMRFRFVSELLGNYLAKMREHCSAALVLCKAGFYKEAIREYIQADEYNEVTSLLSQIDLSERSTVIKQAASHLVKSKKIDEAVIILEHYNHDVEGALDILRQEKCFKKAISLARRYSRAEQIENELIPEIYHYLNDLESKLNEMETTIDSHTKRLFNIRKNRRLRAEQPLDPNMDHEGLELESVLSLSSYGSSSVEGSTISSRNRKKLERKKQDTRPGSRFEDIALIRELHEIFSSMSILGRTVMEICLIPELKLTIAKVVYDRCIKLQSKMIHLSGEIWPNILINGGVTEEQNELAIIKNREHLDEEYHKPPVSLPDRTWHLRILK